MNPMADSYKVQYKMFGSYHLYGYADTLEEATILEEQCHEEGWLYRIVSHWDEATQTWIQVYDQDSMEDQILDVQWSETESCRYYVDKDKYSRAHNRKTEIILDAFSGTYHFDKKTRKVTLDDGARIRDVSVIAWHLNY